MPSPPPSTAGDASGTQGKVTPAGRSTEAAARQTVVTTLVAAAANGFWADFHSFLERLPVPTFVGVLATGVLGGLLLRGRGPAGVLARLAGRLGPPTSKMRDWFLAPLSQRPRMAKALAALRRVLPTVVIAYLSVASGVVVILGVWGASQGVSALVRWVSSPSCADPRELSVITAPENVDALRDAAAAYTDEADGCTPYRISVGAAPSAAEMSDGFTLGWCRDDESFPRLFGRRPDAWIATSTAEVAHVRRMQSPLVSSGQPCDGMAGGRATLSPGPSVAGEQLIVAMLAERADDLKNLPPEQKGDKTLADVVGAIRTRLGMRLVYPQPGLSSAGLIAAARLVGLERPEDTVRSVASDDSADALLCRFKRMTKAEKQGYALLVPAHSVQEYNSGEITNEGCGGMDPKEPRLDEVQPPGMPVLDYPFVDITWPDENAPASRDESAERRLALGRFAGWLAHKHPLFGGPVQPPALRSGADELGDAKDEIARRLHRVDLQFLLDVSGSMSRLLLPTSEALPEIRQTLIEADRLSLSTFWQDKDEGIRISDPTDKEGASQLGRFVGRFRQERSRGRDAPLSNAIDELGRKFGLPGRSVVVVTDGGPFGAEGIPGRAEQDIVRALKRSSSITNLYILVFGHGGCGGRFPQPERPPGSSQHVVCAEIEGGQSPRTGTQAVASALNRAIFTLRGWS
ncbi:VWA domain-containing protein [Microbispora sp. RL4-1S]|uniref:VWA domain-containing protein n=1 Tax=Microbispora oryzae TaxID=2806554 RepID=A0A940WIN2_9ACTN|nr:vWA domain-containing protein [Microbispora oryzae]MBP2704657.1 VWA domain-containing protein [Microbispora oryzae]